MLDRCPYSVLSCDELEDAALLLDPVGVERMLGTKVADPALRRWPFGTYLRHSFPDEWRTRSTVFKDAAEAMFDRSIMQADH